MVRVWISELDGDVHFKTMNSSAYEFDTCIGLFKSCYLKYDLKTKDWVYPIRIAVLNVISTLKAHDINVEISKEDVDVISLALYPPSDELKKVRYSIDKNLLENHPPLKGEFPHEDYQLQAMKKFVTQNRLILNLFPRLGKTYISSLGIASLFKNGVLDCVLAIMRPEGCSNYAREIVYFTDGIVKEEDIIILDKDHRDIESYFDKKIIIISYNSWRLCNEYYLKKNKITAKKPKKPFIHFDKWFSKRLLLCDEAQALCNESLQSHYTLIHSEYFERRCVMSGSIGYSYEKTYNLAKLLLPQRMSTMSKSEWWKYLTEETNSRWNRNIIPERLKEYEENILNKIMISFGEECLKVTDNYKHDVYVTMSDKMREIYKIATNEFILDVMKQGDGKITYGNFKKTFPTLRQITDDPSLLDVEKWNMEKDSPKIEVLKSILDDRIEDKGKNVILWCNSPKTMKTLTEIFSKYNPICVNGNEQLCGIKRKDRGDIIERIKTDESCRLLITNQVLSTSVSFWRFTINIYWAVPLDTDYYNQSIRRISGSGQKENIETIHLLYDRSIDNYLMESLLNKSKIKKYFDNYADSEEVPSEVLKEILNPKHVYTIEGDLR